MTFNSPADTVAQPFYRWTVPAGVCSATFDLYGAEGSATTGRGAEVISTLAVVPGAQYDIYVGGWGTVGKGGYNGGGAASGGGVGGGGATDVRTGPGLADRILVAAGGGGNGGAGSGSSQGLAGIGGLVGQDGTTAPGAFFSGSGGRGATGTAGGEGGFNGATSTSRGTPGSLGVGGAGSLGGSGGGGGGGGGGYYGGGGGGAGSDGGPGGGGGGGSSLTAGGTVSPIPHSGKGKAIITYAASTCPASSGPGGSGKADTAKPALGRLSLSKASFKAATSGPSIGAGSVGVKVSFTLSKAGSLKFAVQRKTTGRKVRRKCKARSRSNRKAKPCVRWTAVKASFTVAGKAGRNSVRFRGRVGGKSLKPGRYRLSVQVKGTSRLRYKEFRIVSGRP